LEKNCGSDNKEDRQTGRRARKSGSERRRRSKGRRSRKKRK